MRTAIIVRTDNTIEGYTGFKKMCNLLELPYNYLKRLPYPINYKGMIIDKVELKQRLTFECLPFGGNLKTENNKIVTNIK